MGCGNLYSYKTLAHTFLDLVLCVAVVAHLGGVSCLCCVKIGHTPGYLDHFALSGLAPLAEGQIMVY